MKKILLIVVVALTLTAIPAHEGICEDSGLNLFNTFGAMNGRRWNILDEHQKSSYIMGFREGLLAASVDDTAEVGCQSYPALLKASIPNATNGEVANVITDFYKDSANVNIPVFVAFQYARNKIAGATKEELDKLAASMRAAYNNP